MAQKQNDLVLNMLANPTFSVGDFGLVGLTANNTALQSEDTYLKSNKIIENPMFLNDNGEFDKLKFHNVYMKAADWYNVMSNDDAMQLSLFADKFHRSNIWAPLEYKRKGPDFEWVKTPNADRELKSLTVLGLNTPGKKSLDEIAQGLKLLLNPAEATNADGTINPAKAKWGDPMDKGILSSGFWKNFFDTLVLATWDEDGEHYDPVLGTKISHKKGDPKLNENGTYYYENLDGRDVYGKRVLNKMNILTPEDSWINKYDFFDSDDKEEKSFVGNVMKNLALVGSMYIPYVGPWVAGASVLTQSVGLLGTLGKVISGSDSPTFSALEGWSKSMNRQEAKSEYAQQHPWSLENMIGMIGDVMGLFKELRILFKYAPAIFKGKYGIDDVKMSEREAALRKIWDKKAMESTEDILKKSVAKGVSTELAIVDVTEALHTMLAIANLKVMADLDAYIKGYNKIGSALAKAYMTGITVADTYEEAKLQGATDLEASLLTIGYGAGEAAILNTGLGEWLFPELRHERKQQLAVAKALTRAKKEVGEVNKESLKMLEGEKKRDYAKHLIKIGKETAEDLYKANKSIGSKTIKEGFYNAMAEGLEEVTEEALADFSKACFNTVEWMRGKDTRINTNMYNFETGEVTLENMFNAYGLNFLGGFVGGGIAGFSLDNIKYNKSLENMDFNQAALQLVYYSRNGKSEEFLKTANKMTLGYKNLSASKYIRNEDGKITFEQGTETDNLDLAAKTALKQQVDIIDNILSSEGIKMSDLSFLSQYTEVLPDLKLTLLQNSATACRFLQEFNTLGTDMAYTIKALGGSDPLKNEKTDSKLREDKKDSENKSTESTPNADKTAKKLDKESEERLKKANLDKLELLRILKEDLLSGKRAPEFIGDAIFEMSSALNHNLMIPPSFIRFAEYKARTTFDKITDSERKRLKDEYDNWSELDKADLVHINAEIFRNVIKTLSPAILEHATDYETLVEDKNADNLYILGTKYWDLVLLGIKDNKVNAELFYTLDKDMLELLHYIFTDKTALDKIDAYKKEEEELYVLQQQLKLTIQLLEIELLGILDSTELTEELKALALEQKAIQLVEIKAKLLENEKLATEKLEERDYLLATTLPKELVKLTQSFFDRGFMDYPTRAYIKRSIYKATNIDGTGILDTNLEYYQKEIETLQKKIKQSETDIEEYEEFKDLGWEDKVKLEQEQLKINLLKIALIEETIGEIQKPKAELELMRSKINDIPATPITKLLDKFAISDNGTLFNISLLVKKLEDAYEKVGNSLDLFTLGDLTLLELEEALNIINIADVTIEGTKVDTGSVYNAFGYSKTLNEVNHAIGTENYEDLAEISDSTGNIIQLDLRNLLTRLKTLRELHYLNNGLKLTELKKVSTHSHYLFFNRMQSFAVDIPDKDNDGEEWKNKDVLLEALEKCKELKEYARKLQEKPDTSIALVALETTLELYKTIEKEIIQLEDAIYQFFLDNADKLKNPEKLCSLFFKKSNDGYDSTLNLLDLPKNELSLTTTRIDDNSFFWWLASRAAVKSSSFNKTLIKAIKLNKRIAPIATLKYATFVNFAATINGDLFTLFTKAAKTYTLKKWDTLNTEQKTLWVEEQLKSLILGNDTSNVFGILTKDSMENVKDFPFLNIIVPKYAHIVLVEGGPGTGKTTGVFKMTMCMLKAMLNDTNLPSELKAIIDKLLSNIKYAHGTNIKKAEEGALSLGLDKSSVISVDDLIKLATDDLRLTPEKVTKEFKNGEKKTITVWTSNGSSADVSKMYKLKDGNLEVLTNIKNIRPEDVPSIIFIDEVTNLTIWDLDVLEKFADKYGITILTAGDYDLSGASGVLEIDKKNPDFKDLDKVSSPAITYRAYNINFIRSPRLGVSMRAGCSLLVENISAAQKWVNSTPDAKLLLHYHLSDKGLFGTKVILNPKLTEELLKADIDLLISTLKPRETIGYIYDEKAEQISKIYKLLHSPEYEGKIIPYKNNAALGSEGLYFIVDLYTDCSTNYDDRHNIFTAISRSSLGTLLAGKNSDTDSDQTVNDIITNVHMDGNTQPLEINEVGINTYRDLTIEILLGIAAAEKELPKVFERSKNTATLNPPKKEDSSEEKPSTTEGGLGPSEQEKLALEWVGKFVTFKNGIKLVAGLVSNVTLAGTLQISKPDGTSWGVFKIEDILEKYDTMEEAEKAIDPISEAPVSVETFESEENPNLGSNLGPELAELPEPQPEKIHDAELILKLLKNVKRISISKIPELYKTTILNAVNQAKLNPYTPATGEEYKDFYSNDAASELKYGDIVLYGSTSDAKYGVVAGLHLDGKLVTLITFKDLLNNSGDFNIETYTIENLITKKLRPKINTESEESAITSAKDLLLHLDPPIGLGDKILIFKNNNYSEDDTLLEIKIVRGKVKCILKKNGSIDLLTFIANVQSGKFRKIRTPKYNLSKLPTISELDKAFALDLITNNLVDLSIDGILPENCKIINVSGKNYLTVININGVNVPFYVATKNGKSSVRQNIWYPLFGIEGDPDGKWDLTSEGAEKEINAYYGSPILRAIAELLNETYPKHSLDADPDIPKLEPSKQLNLDLNILLLSLINKDLRWMPTELEVRRLGITEQSKIDLLLGFCQGFPTSFSTDARNRSIEVFNEFVEDLLDKINTSYAELISLKKSEEEFAMLELLKTLKDGDQVTKDGLIYVVKIRTNKDNATVLSLSEPTFGLSINNLSALAFNRDGYTIIPKELPLEPTSTEAYNRPTTIDELKTTLELLGIKIGTTLKLRNGNEYTISNMALVSWGPDGFDILISCDDGFKVSGMNILTYLLLGTFEIKEADPVIPEKSFTGNELIVALPISGVLEKLENDEYYGCTIFSLLNFYPSLEWLGKYFILKSTYDESKGIKELIVFQDGDVWLSLDNLETSCFISLAGFTVDLITNGLIHFSDLTFTENEGPTKNPDVDSDTSLDSEDSITTTSEDINELLNDFPKIDITQAGKVSEFNILGHSFNSFETGVLELPDLNNLPVPYDPLGASTRIDSMNGLMKLRLTKPNTNIPVDYDDYIIILTKIRRAVFNADNDVEICDKVLLILLEYGYKGTALKSCYGIHTLADNQATKQSKDFRALELDPRELLYGMVLERSKPGEDVDNYRRCRTKLSLVFGEVSNNLTKDILELPLLILSSPITICKELSMGNFNDWTSNLKGLLLSEVNLFIAEIPYDITNPTTALDFFTKVLNNKIPGVLSMPKSLIDLIKLYVKVTSNCMLRIPPELGFSICKLENYGCLPIGNRRGNDYGVSGLEHKVALLNLSYVVNRPELTISDIYVTESSLYENNEGNILDGEFIPYQPVVFVTSDPTLDKDELADVYLALMNAKLRGELVKHRVSIVTVIPPKCSIENYLHLLRMVISGEINKNTRQDPVGSNITAIKIVASIITNPELRLLLDLFPILRTYVQSLDKFFSDRNNEKIELGFDTKTIKYLLQAGTMSSVFTDISIKEACLDFLVKLAFTFKSGNFNIIEDSHEGAFSLNEAGMDIINNAMKSLNLDGINYLVRINKSEKGFFKRIEQGPNYTLPSNISSPIKMDDPNFKISGKIDPNTYRLNLEHEYDPKGNGLKITLLESVLPKASEYVTVNGSSIARPKSNFAYINKNFVQGRSSSLIRSTLDNIISHVKNNLSRLGINFDESILTIPSIQNLHYWMSTTTKGYQQALELYLGLIVKLLLSIPVLAFVIDRKLLIFNHSKYNSYRPVIIKNNLDNTQKYTNIEIIPKGLTGTTFIIMNEKGDTATINFGENFDTIEIVDDINTSNEESNNAEELLDFDQLKTNLLLCIDLNINLLPPLLKPFIKTIKKMFTTGTLQNLIGFRDLLKNSLTLLSNSKNELIKEILENLKPLIEALYNSKNELDKLTNVCLVTPSINYNIL